MAESPYCDPITLFPPDDPYLASDGWVYDKDTLDAACCGRRWLSPITKEVLRPLIYPCKGGEPRRLYSRLAPDWSCRVDHVKAASVDPQVAVFLGHLASRHLGTSGLFTLRLNLAMESPRVICGPRQDPVVQGWALRLVRALGLKGTFENPEALCSAYPTLETKAGLVVEPGVSLEEDYIACGGLWMR